MNKPKNPDSSDIRDSNEVDPTAHTEHAMPVMPEIDESIPEDQRVTLPVISPEDFGKVGHAKTEHDMHAIEPTIAVEAITDLKDLPPAKIVSMPPPAPSIAPPSIRVRQDESFIENFDVIDRSVAIITNEKGSATIATIPLFTGFSTNHYDGNEEYDPKASFFTIGTDPLCDIHLEKIDNPCIQPHHAIIKIQNGKAFIRGKEGLVRLNGEPAITWQEVDPEKDIVKIIPKQGNHGVKIMEPRYLKINPRQVHIEEEDQKVMIDTLRTRATNVVKAMNQAIQTLLKDPAHNPELAEKVQQLGALLQELIDIDTDIGYCCLKSHALFFMRYFDIAKETKDQMENVLAEVREIDGIRAEIDKRTKHIEAMEKAHHSRACELWEVDDIHFTPDEDPLNKEQVPYVFRCPVFTIKKNGGMTSKPVPMLIPAMDIGTHPVCHIELDPSSESKPNSKNHIAPFAGKLFYQYEGGERVLYFQYLQPNVLIKSTETSAKKVPPPTETFRVTEDMTIHIGGYELKVDNRTHGFTYGSIKNDLLGSIEKPGIIDELFECIDDQAVTTWEQDDQAIRYLQAIIEGIEQSNLPEEEKQEFRDKYQEKYEKITLKLIGKIQDGWREEEPHADSGHFQTLLLFAQAEDGFAREAQCMYAPDGILKYEAERRVHIYTRNHHRALPESENTILGRWKNRSTRQWVEPDVNPTAAVEVARFLEFGLIEDEQVEDLGRFTDRIQKILKVREQFRKLDNDHTNLEEILELRDLCNNLSMNDIFAAEEIETRNLHIEVDMKPEGKAKEYVRKICIFQARKAFKRLKESNDPEHIRADEALITGLCVVGIMQKFELIDNVNDFIPQDEIDAIISQKREENPAATDEELRNQIKTQEANDLISEQLTKAEALEQAEKARERLEEDINQAVKHVAIIQDQNMNARDKKGMSFEELQQMMPLTKVVFSPGLRKVMDDTTYDLHVDEIEYNAGKARAKATPTRLNWHRIFKQWIGRFQSGLRLVGRKSLSSGENLEAMYQMVDYALTQGYVNQEDFSQIHGELRRAAKAKQYKTAASAAAVTNFDYLEQTPIHKYSTPRDKDFYESVKNEITAQKLQQMIDGYRSGTANEKFKYQMKIKELQRKEPIATDILKRMDLTAKERDLLQLSA
ncbi:MAG: FHA domain-containing protein [Candidatus Gracilibacteria bacterium]